MKLLTTFSKKEFVLEDDEAVNVERIIIHGEKGFIKLRSGETINTQGIEAITNTPLVARYKGYPVTKDGLYFIEDGEKILISEHSKIEYVADPKYLKIGEVKLLN